MADGMKKLYLLQNGTVFYDIQFYFVMFCIVLQYLERANVWFDLDYDTYCLEIEPNGTKIYLFRIKYENTTKNMS